jgi:hypothetical protein
MFRAEARIRVDHLQELTKEDHLQSVNHPVHRIRKNPRPERKNHRQEPTNRQAAETNHLEVHINPSLLPVVNRPPVLHVDQ